MTPDYVIAHMVDICECLFPSCELRAIVTLEVDEVWVVVWDVIHALNVDFEMSLLCFFNVIMSKEINVIIMMLMRMLS